MNCKNEESILEWTRAFKLLKSEQSLAELCKSNSNNAEIEKTKNNFNELRNKFSKLIIKEIRKRLYGIEKGLENEEKKDKKIKRRTRKKDIPKNENRLKIFWKI